MESINTFSYMTFLMNRATYLNITYRLSYNSSRNGLDKIPQN